MQKKKTSLMVALAMFAALVIVLQVVATFIKIGSFPITLTLVPIIVAGALYGPKAGSLMGLVFGVVVLAMVVVGADPGGQALFALRPLVTSVVCIIKGVLAGLAAAETFKVISKKNKKFALFMAGLVCPLVNTGTLYLVLFVFFEASLASILSALMSVNFLIEVCINALLAPGLYILINNKSS